MTQRWNWVEGGLGWLHPYRPSPPQSFKFPPCLPPTYPSFATPLCIIYCQEKGTETRKEGSRKGGAVHPLTHSQNPGGVGVGQGFGPKPQPPRNPHSRGGTPQIRDRLLLQFPSSSWGQGPHLYCVCVCVCDHPSLESLWPKTSAWNWNEGSGGGGVGSEASKALYPDPDSSGLRCSPRLGMASQALCWPFVRLLRGLHGTFSLWCGRCPLLLLLFRGPLSSDWGSRGS